jgi:hypothetical protein
LAKNAAESSLGDLLFVSRHNHYPPLSLVMAFVDVLLAMAFEENPHLLKEPGHFSAGKLLKRHGDTPRQRP